MHPRQMNADQLDALPELRTERDGQAPSIAQNEVVSWLSADGGYWQTAQHSDGTWCKRRIG